MATDTVTMSVNTTDPPKEAHCIFQQPWWLEAAAPGRWGEAVVKSGGITRARLPYVIRKSFGFAALTMAPHTPRLGPWLRLTEGSQTRRLAQEKELTNQLLAQLPKFDVFIQHFSTAITNWLPFYWAGFQQTTRYSYRLDDVLDLEKVRAGFHRTTREQIRKAEGIVSVRDDLGVDRFIEMNKMTYERQGLDARCDPAALRRIDAACEQNHCRQILFAEDAQGNTHAALFIVWDEQCVYTIMAGSDPKWRRSGAGSLLFWHAIQLASEQGKTFDFEGTMVERIERHFRNYGAHPVPYFRVWKTGRAVRALCAACDIWGALRGNRKEDFIGNPGDFVNF